VHKRWQEEVLGKILFAKYFCELKPDFLYFINIHISRLLGRCLKQLFFSVWITAVAWTEKSKLKFWATCAVLYLYPWYWYCKYCYVSVLIGLLQWELRRL